MRLSSEGQRLIERWEGRRNTMYLDSAGLPTIGIGHLIKPNEAWMRTATLTDKQIDDLFRQDIAVFEQAVREEFPNVTRQNQFDALVSFTYNLGQGAVDRGSLDELVNSKAPAEDIAAKWMQYVMAGGRRVQGLVNRRSAELQLFFAHLWRIAAILIIVAAFLFAGAGTLILTA